MHLTKLQQQLEMAKNTLQDLELKVSEAHRKRDLADTERDRLIL